MPHDPHLAPLRIEDVLAALDARDLEHLDLVPPPRTRLRRHHRTVHLHLSRIAARHGITRRLVLLGSTLPAAWTLGMIVLAWTVRYG